MSDPSVPPPPSPWHHHSLLRQFNMIERVPTPRFPSEIAPIIEQTLKLDEPEEKENMVSLPSSSSSCTTMIHSSSAHHHHLSSSLIRPIHPTIHDPSELVDTFTHVLREMVQQNAARATHQDKMNHVNGQLHAMSFFLNYANAARGKQMMENYHGLRREIASGRELLESMATVVASQDRALKSMTAEVERLGDVTERQGRAYTDLDARVEQQKRDVLAAMEEYDEKLSQQEAAISRQDALLQRLLSVRFRMDFGIDLIILLCSYWISHSRLLSFIIRNGAYLILPRPNLLYAQQRRRNVEAFIQLIRLFTFLGVARRLRHAAVHYGLHNLVGNYSQYGRVALSTVQSASVALVSAAPTDVYSQVMLMSQTVTSGIKSVAIAAIGWDQDETIKSSTLTYKNETPTHGKYPSLKQMDPVTPLPPFKVPLLQLPGSASIQTYSSSPSPASSSCSSPTHSQHPTCPHSPP